MFGINGLLMDSSAPNEGDFDEKDLQLLEHVEDDFDKSLEELADELDLSKSAIHYRLKKHRERGVIKSVNATLDPLAFGLNMMVITNVSVTHERGYAEEIGERLSAVKGVEQVYYTMGDVDFVVISRVQNRTQMNDLIDEIISIDGVNETSSQFVMNELKTDRKVISNMSEQMRAGIGSRTD
ncbi:Lrp/AsnC family transcriptional regulator [Halegenticoccus tardaugens]|uniref:Lrp/AsnC family transcriptional regulator n=1 Tax=Halegenticoccus tardaugens TaxID=2071624 RepID=UPI001E2D8615|nr:Lrp/AsnC family transcriptional regulator [Halegenticoccus tardaugens]